MMCKCVHERERERVREREFSFKSQRRGKVAWVNREAKSQGEGRVSTKEEA
jgi:hypothetical protein